MTFSRSLNQSLFCRQRLVGGLWGPGLLPSQHSPWADHGRLLLPWPLLAATTPLACGLPASMPPGGLCPRHCPVPAVAQRKEMLLSPFLPLSSVIGIGSSKCMQEIAPPSPRRDPAGRKQSILMSRITALLLLFV